MEAGFALCGLAAVSAFACAFGACQAVLSGRRLRRPVPGQGLQGGALARVLRSGVPLLRRPARFALQARRVKALMEEAASQLSAGGRACSAESLAQVCIAAAAGLFAVCWVLFGTPWCAAAVLALAVAVAVGMVKSRAEKEADRVRESIPDALRNMSACFQSGFSLLQTLQQVADTTSGALAGLFGKGAHALETGSTAGEALAFLQNVKGAPELTFAAVALDVQHQTGGSMQQCLDAACQMVEDELDIQRSLRVQTAQARLSARVVSIMPFALVALFSVVSTGYLDPFFQSPVGMAMLGVALGMQAAGVLAVRRMLKVG